ncbi:MAG: SDR family oxidoreductase, partial [Ignavibacteriales bacterium]|nr:SDR family oxidoreductase [Ignavibacteriales bacterium]
ALAGKGANVILASRRTELLRAKADELYGRFGIQTYAVAMDLTSKPSIDKAMDEVWSRFPAVDILVNNSGVGVDAPAVELREEDFDRVLDTNLKGAFLLTQAVLPRMIARRSGHILNISSQAGKHGYARATAYCASKYGVLGFAHALQEEVRQHNIKVTNLLPGLVQVPPSHTPAETRGNVLQVEDLASAAVYVLQQPERVQIEDIGLFHL